ncbi:hypothetical protein [Snodgrassella alvi]|uniref:hypothetical protein n=1 Tax=Snodgrassella alvi TaxID=1196083 RepID=UPI0015D5345D|nr:hypothetical protein [Snodgrassella alvi]
MRIDIGLVLLGNMSIEEPHKAVSRCKVQYQTEALDNLRADTILAVAKAGVDFLVQGGI